MATKKTKKASSPIFVVVEPKDVHRGDTIYIENNEYATPYFVIDIGEPFMLIEDLNTHFGYFYHYTTIYKKR